MKPKQYKQWTLPGPILSATAFEPALDESLDALSGHFKIFQRKDGHRFSTDDVLVSIYASLHAPQATRILELGCGICSVGMMVAWHKPQAQFLGIEAQTLSFELGKKSLGYNGLSDRYEIRLGDFRDESALSEKDGLFDLILSSPPYFKESAGILAPDSQKRFCRFELRGDLTDYARVASQHLAPAGWFASIYPYQYPEKINEALHAVGLRLLRLRPVVFKEGEPPLLAVFLAGKSDDFPERVKPWIDPPLTIRTRDGLVSPEYQVLKLSIGFPP